jgi:hypothetical protein
MAYLSFNELHGVMEKAIEEIKKTADSSKTHKRTMSKQ